MEEIKRKMLLNEIIFTICWLQIGSSAWLYISLICTWRLLEPQIGVENELLQFGHLNVALLVIKYFLSYANAPAVLGKVRSCCLALSLRCLSFPIIIGSSLLAPEFLSPLALEGSYGMSLGMSLGWSSQGSSSFCHEGSAFLVPLLPRMYPPPSLSHHSGEGTEWGEDSGNKTGGSPPIPG